MRRRWLRSCGVLVLAAAGALLGGMGNAMLGVCGPFTDVTDAGFCPFVLEIFYLGITTGTSPTTYDPTSSVSRLQMAAFLSRSVDGVLKRGGRRAALDQFWTMKSSTVLALTTVGTGPQLLKSDGQDVWAASESSGTVARVSASDGKLLQTWTGASNAIGVLVAVGRVFVTGAASPGRLYRIDPALAAGVVTTVASTLGNGPHGIAFDGERIWTANEISPGSISIVTPGASLPWTVTTVTAGFANPIGILYDGAAIWTTDGEANTLLKLDSTGAILQTVTVGTTPIYPAFDGTNIWVPNSGSPSVSVVRASTGAVLQTLTGNGLDEPRLAAFDGQRVLVTNFLGNSVSFFKAADLSPLGSVTFGAGGNPFGACSDGIDFWIGIQNKSVIARF